LAVYACTKEKVTSICSAQEQLLPAEGQTDNVRKLEEISFGIFVVPLFTSRGLESTAAFQHERLRDRATQAAVVVDSQERYSFAFGEIRKNPR
jgi:hypothetical protein